MKGYASSPGEGDLSKTADRNQIRIGLIDSLRFSQDCLIKAFSVLHPDLIIVPFSTVEECARATPSDLDVILYYRHDGGLFEALALQKVKALRQSFNKVPIVVLSDARSALRLLGIRTTLNSGAQGIISALTTELPATKCW